MERAKWPALSGLVLGTIVLTNHAKNTFAFDRPIHSAVAVLLYSGGALIVLSRWLPKDTCGAREYKGGQYDAVPLDEVGEDRADQGQREDVTYPSSLRKLRLLWLLLVVTICLRAEILRQVVTNVQCAGRAWAPMLPLLFAIWDWWAVQRAKKRREYDDAAASAYEAFQHRLLQAPWSCALMVALVTLGGILALISTSSPRSTYICAAGLPYQWTIPHLQWVGTLLDFFIVFLISSILRRQDGARNTAVRIAAIGWALFVSAGFWLIVGVVYWLVQRTGRKWLLTIPPLYFWSVLRLSNIVALTLVSALISILHVGIVSTTLIPTFTSILTITTTAAWSSQHPFPPTLIGLAYPGVCILLLAVVFYFQIETSSESRSVHTFHRIPGWLYLSLFTLFLIWTGFWATHKDAVDYHPIDFLIYEAQAQHETFVEQAASSNSLEQAVYAYTARYNRHPPPGFDKWYTYATERDSAIIDDFDNIHQDILPFFALTPQEIRDRTWQMISNPWNDAAGIMIRDQKVVIAPNVMPTHKWMLDGLVDMISKFAEWLPDMDLAFNLNDECRVAIPYEKIEHLRRLGERRTLPPDVEDSFTPEREQHWKAIPQEQPEHPEQDSPLEHVSWQQTFHRFGNVGCPPSSPARTQRKWDTSSLCTRCVYPHSLGAFLANWTLAGDACHQPDLADLHGIYLSPAAFKGTHELYPIFSQSKVGGYNDILYPSAWNYMYKAKYAPDDNHRDPSFAEKETTLFWRGATSEGVSHDMSQWRGMTRQRFVHLANNINGSNADMPLLLPSPSHPGKLEYRYVPTSTLTQLLHADVKFVDSIVRCAGTDCDHQAKEFSPLAPPKEFQDHWKYKYLLDLDGAGFSGRFLPFLRSRSLPFKAAVFREWWGGRVTAWKHFVPLDIRGHGTWATLAYFAGLDSANSTATTIDKTTDHGSGTLDAVKDAPERRLGRRREEGRAEAHEWEAERIATEGREWAERVLRKEDMEIYFFRLLLEWGRMTDDRRDKLGFSGA